LAVLFRHYAGERRAEEHEKVHQGNDGPQQDDHLPVAGAENIQEQRGNDDRRHLAPGIKGVHQRHRRPFLIVRDGIDNGAEHHLQQPARGRKDDGRKDQPHQHVTEQQRRQAEQHYSQDCHPICGEHESAEPVAVHQPAGDDIDGYLGGEVDPHQQSQVDVGQVVERHQGNEEDGGEVRADRLDEDAHETRECGELVRFRGTPRGIEDGFFCGHAAHYPIQGKIGQARDYSLAG